MKILSGIFKTSAVEKLLSAADALQTELDANDREIRVAIFSFSGQRNAAAAAYQREPNAANLKALIRATSDAVAASDDDMQQELLQHAVRRAEERWRQLLPLVQPAVEAAQSEIDTKIETVRQSAKERADLLGLDAEIEDPAIKKLEDRKHRLSVALQVHAANANVRAAANSVKSALL